jgi:hypothetical protein
MLSVLQAIWQADWTFPSGSFEAAFHIAARAALGVDLAFRRK